MKQKTLIVVVGPTAVGKTAVSIALAKHYKTEIISADSRQFYKEMNIGTAKPSIEELSQVPHHLVDQLSVAEKYTVKDFEEAAMDKIAAIHAISDTAILVGGSGLYVQALCDGLDEMPEVPTSYRKTLKKELELGGLEDLLSELKEQDPQYYEMVDKSNPQRVIRALEVCRHTGTPYSAYRKRKKIKRPFRIIKIGLFREREELYQIIDERMDDMIQNGLFKEATELFPYRHLNALQTVGYSEIFDFIDNKQDREETIRLLKRNSRRYAKRQVTWFGRDKEIEWFKPENVQDIFRFIDDVTSF